MTLHGTGFKPLGCALMVGVGPNAVQSPSSPDGTTITFGTGAGWSGQVNVTLQGPDNIPVTDNNHLIYATDPGGSSLDNATPPTSAAVHFLGQGFDFHLPGWETATASYTWAGGPGGGCPAPPPPASPSINDDTHISVQMPAQYCHGVVSLAISAPLDANHTGPSDPRMTLPVLSASFNIAPVVSGQSRSSAVPGQTVVVTGSGFGGQGGAASVNGLGAAVPSWTDSSVTVVVPRDATSGGLSLTRAVDGAPITPGNLTVVAQISGLSPAKAAVGDAVTVTGAGFGPSAGTVKIGGTAAPVQGWSSTSITFVVPDGATTNAVNLGTNGTAPPAGPPSLGVVPRITGITPPHATAGSLIEIDGTTFGTQQGGVQIAGQDAQVTLWGDKSVLVMVPSSLGPGSVPVSVAPPGNDAATAAWTVDAAPPSPTAAPGGGGAGQTPGSSGGSTPGASPTPGLILPSPGGPVISHGPVAFVKPSAPPGPVSLKLDTSSSQADPGKTVSFTVTLIAFGKPIAGAPVDLLLVIEPGSDAAVDPAHAVTDAEGKVTGTIRLSRTAGDHIVLARSGIYSDEVRVVGRGATTAVAAGANIPGGSAAAPAPQSPLLSVRSPVLWALFACLLLFGAGFGLNLLTAPAAGGAVVASAGGDERSPLREGVAAVGSVARFGAGIVVVVAAQALGALRRH